MAAKSQFSLVLDSELQDVWRAAARIGAKSREEHLHSFTTVLLGILQTQGPTSDWFRHFSKSSGVDEPAMWRQVGVSPGMMETEPPPAPTKGDTTVSASTVLANAEEFQRATGSKELGVRHVLASYFLRTPPDHVSQLADWRLDSTRAAAALVEFARRQFPDEAVAWSQYSATAPSAKADLSYKFSQRAYAILQLARQWVDSKPQDVAPALRALSSSALFFALVESGRTDSDLTAAMLFHYIEQSGLTQAYEAERQRWQQSPAATNGDVSTALQACGPWTPNVLNVMAKAAEIAHLTHVKSEDEIAVRHVLIALLMIAPDTHLQQRIGVIGFDRDFIFQDFANGIRIGRLPGDNAGAWNVLLSSVPLRRLIAGYDSDSDRGTDLLNLADEVEGFATLIASADLKPPLSIAVFGKWGSGKSFFMRLLYERVVQIAGTGSASFCSRIAQIKFNAWHYTDQNLWASLVSQIFDGLFSRITPTSSTATEIKERLEEQEGLYKEAKLRLDAAVKASAAAEQKLNDLVEKRKQREEGFGGLLNDLGALIVEDPTVEKAVTEVSNAAGLREPIESYEALESEVSNLRSLAGRIDALRRTTRPAILVAALLTPIFLPLLIAGLLLWLHNSGVLKGLGSLSGAVVTFIGSVLVWLVPLTGRAAGLVASPEQGLNRVRRARQNWIINHTAKQQSELAALRAKEEAARAELNTIQARVEQLQQERDDLQPGRQMLKFIRERSGSGDYRQYMGLISLIRKDFQTLSELLVSQGSDAPVQRIVLYVDDLDRCPPDRVVEVLEAIHLLLAFSLFVVVVGVDSRWIAHSLSVKYPGLLRVDVHHAGSAASPNDYLEKIFQIPFWMRPISEEGSKKLIRGLIPLATQETIAKPQRSEGGAYARASEADFESPFVPDQNLKQVAEPRNTGTNDRLEVGHGEKSASVPNLVSPSAPEPERLRIEALELDYMSELAPFLGDSPRRIKRFINSYRLIKASLPAREALKFMGSGSQPGEFRAAQVVLAMHTAAPGSAAEVSRHLNRPEPPQSVTDLLKQIDSSDHSDLVLGTGLLQKYRQAWGEDLRTLSKWDDVIVRYSFEPQ